MPAKPSTRSSDKANKMVIRIWLANGSWSRNTKYPAMPMIQGMVSLQCGRLWRKAAMTGSVTAQARPNKPAGRHINRPIMTM